MGQDFRFALRMLLSHRWFSLAIVATLALGIGLNTTVFTLIDAALFKPVPVPGGDRLISILTRDTTNPDGHRARMPVSWLDFEDYRAHANSFETLEAGSADSAILSENQIAPDHYHMMSVSAGFFRMLHIAPVLGRDFNSADTRTGAPAVVLIGYSIWKQRYAAGDPIGRVVRVDGKPATIIGVMPSGFRFPSEEDLWMALQPGPVAADRSKRPLQVFGTLKPGVSMAQASAGLAVISTRLAAEHPKEDKNTAALLQTFHERYNGDQIQTVFSLMMAAVGFVLLIACANVANMLLGRALARRRELSIRAALGASRWRIVRQLLIESLLFSLIGGVAGLGLAAVGVHQFDLATQDVGKPYWVQFSIDYRVFFYFAIVCIASALAFGLMPALRSSKDTGADLKDGSRSAGTRYGGKLAGALVVFQFALTLVLLLGAAVFMRTFIDKQRVNAWMPAGSILTARLHLPAEHYKDPESRQRFFDDLLSRLRAIPGVESVGAASDLPGTGSGTRHFEVEGRPVSVAARASSARVVVISPGYLQTIGLPLLRGSDFKPADGAASQRRAIVTRDFASRMWGAADPIGRRFRFFEKDDKPGEWIQVAGVSADMVQQPLEKTDDPLLFLPYRQDSYDWMGLALRAAHPSSAAAPVRSAIRAIDRDLPLYEVRTMAELSDKQLWFLSVFGTIFLFFAGMALLMASVGIYAVMAQATSSRTREIGVRIAIGASPGRIVRLILRRGIAQLAAGLALGLAAVWPVTRVMDRLQFLDAPADPLVLAAVAAILCGAGLFACWLPARRAAALNPISAIRED